MKFFSAAPISTPTFRPAQFPAPQRQSAATDTGTQPTPQGSPVVTGFKAETRSRNTQLASPTPVAPDPMVVDQPAPIAPYNGPAQSAPVMPAPVEPVDPYGVTALPEPQFNPIQVQKSILERATLGQPLTVADVLAAQRAGADPAFVQAIRDYALGRGWNYQEPQAPWTNQLRGTVDALNPGQTTTTVAPQQGMVVPVGAATQKMQNWNAIAGQVQPQQFSPAATQLAGAVTRATNTPRSRSGIYTGLAR